MKAASSKLKQFNYCAEINMAKKISVLHLEMIDHKYEIQQSKNRNFKKVTITT